MSLFKDFASNIGGIAKDSALAGLSKGIRQTQLNSLIKGNNTNSESEYFYHDVSLDTNDDNFSLFGITTSTYSNYKSYDDLKQDKFENTKLTDLENPDYKKRYSYRPEDQSADEYSLSLPYWGYNDFINERNVFIKHLSNGFDEPGWFYFKIFFDFTSNHGLFGGILNNDNNHNSTTGVFDSFTNSVKMLSKSQPFSSVNSATDYLIQCKELFKYHKLEDRMVCLQRFTRLLSYININAPWFFKSVKNLSQISKPKLDNLTEEQSIELELDQDAVDMRISTLLSLYKYVCYDDINNKEILPENLRKFDMCIVIFSAPIKFLHNTYQNKRFKTLYNNSLTNKPENIMSFKLYKLLNCEIDIESLGGYVSDDINNDQPFALGQNTIKIKYDKAYEYDMNEYYGLMFGSDGIYLDNPQITIGDINKLVNLSEDKIHNNLNTILKGNSRFVLGNIFRQDKQYYQRRVEDSKTSKVFTDYAKTKLGIMNNNKNYLLNLGYDILYKLLGTGYNANSEVLKVGKQIIGDGTALNGHGDYRVGSSVWRSKMKRMVRGTTGLSDRELRLTIVGKGLHTNWRQNLYDKALGAIKPVI